jgi:methyl-accepting chemotaxis protein
MLNKLSVSVMLKAVIGLLAASVVVILSIGAWEAWGRLQVATRMVHAAEATIPLFDSFGGLRSDRSTTFRDVQAEGQGGISPTLRDLREAEMLNLKAGLVALGQSDLGQAQTGVPALEQAIKKQAAFHQETEQALKQPKATRRAGLAQESFDAANALYMLVEKLSSALTDGMKLEDAYISQLIEIKRQAFVARNAVGDANLLLYNAILGGKVSSETLTKYNENLVKGDAAWAAVGAVAVGLPLPDVFQKAVETAQQKFFDQKVAADRLAILKKLIVGETVAMDAPAWNKDSLERLASVLNVAVVSLRLIKDYAEELRAGAQWKFSIYCAFLFLATTLSLGMMVMISRRIIKPLGMIQGVMLRLAKGDFKVQVPAAERQDEVGQIISSVGVMVGQIRKTLGEIRASASEVTNASAEISTSTTDLSQRTEEQAASLEETSASMEEISSTVKRNAENARHASESANATKKVADRGGQVVAEAVQAMAKIEDSSRKISDIIGVIDEIARQTNLLALNAAVEAARAGEAGRGFAVVASEVRSLAQRSSQAAKDIKDLITNSNGQVKDGVDLVNRAGVALAEIVESISAVAAVVTDIAAASAEQTTGLDEINKALTQMDGVTQQNSALVEENAATAKTLEVQAKLMDEQVAFFQVDDLQSNAGRREHAQQQAQPKKRMAA